jgi:hypothetical protein
MSSSLSPEADSSDYINIMGVPTRLESSTLVPVPEGRSCRQVLVQLCYAINS